MSRTAWRAWRWWGSSSRMSISRCVQKSGGSPKRWCSAGSHAGSTWSITTLTGGLLKQSPKRQCRVRRPKSHNEPSCRGFAISDLGSGFRRVTPREDLAYRCETIERAYEFMLAYAAQGLSGDAGSQSGGELRTLLSAAAGALTNLAAQYAALVDLEGRQPRDKYAAFLDVIGRDAADALAAIELVLAQASISSQVIDNLNASIHVRALLTDVFLVDEILKVADAQQAPRVT